MFGVRVSPDGTGRSPQVSPQSTRHSLEAYRVLYISNNISFWRWTPYWGQKIPEISFGIRVMFQRQKQMTAVGLAIITMFAVWGNKEKQDFVPRTDITLYLWMTYVIVSLQCIHNFTKTSSKKLEAALPDFKATWRQQKQAVNTLTSPFKLIWELVS